MNIYDAAKKWGVSVRSVRNAVKGGRVRSELVGSDVVIPDDEIMALPKSAIQSILWAIAEVKNDPSSRLDVSDVDPLRLCDTTSAFKQLVFRRYIDGVSGGEDASIIASNCRITKKGFALLRRGRLPGSLISERTKNAAIDAAVSLIIFVIREVVKIPIDVSGKGTGE